MVEKFYLPNGWLLAADWIKPSKISDHVSDCPLH